MSGRVEDSAAASTHEAGGSEPRSMLFPMPPPLADTPRDPIGGVFERRLKPVEILDEYEELVYWEHRAAECEEPPQPCGDELDEWALTYRANTATRLRAWAVERRPRLMAAVRQLEMAELVVLLSDAPEGLRELVIATMAGPIDVSDGSSMKALRS